MGAMGGPSHSQHGLLSQGDRRRLMRRPNTKSRMRHDKVMKVMWWEKWVDEKLTEFLEGRITQVQLEADSEAEQSVEGEESEVVGMEDAGATGGTQSLVMEVNEEEEVVVVVMEEEKQGNRHSCHCPNCRGRGYGQGWQ